MSAGERSTAWIDVSADAGIRRRRADYGGDVSQKTLESIEDGADRTSTQTTKPRRLDTHHRFNPQRSGLPYMTCYPLHYLTYALFAPSTSSRPLVLSFGFRHKHLILKHSYNSPHTRRNLQRVKLDFKPTKNSPAQYAILIAILVPLHRHSIPLPRRAQNAPSSGDKSPIVVCSRLRCTVARQVR
ncbi:hypothetical protein M422DRAFT_273633 [Sphaerobolus stellatus SS14]|uniref:Uncharacterized protein n=1 Tax=Sphaerobolus stellatus (strain SS14) TaxID=990650 RepID=A0A0C9U8S4_SPHS4|nr:hypothetical protein M422DRAFT_273633 [Sphaerobolus stellatus SS14]